jgi:hypothetical protein
LQTDQLVRERSHPIGVSAAPPKVHPHVAAVGPTQVRKRLRERSEHVPRQATYNLPRGIVFVARPEHADAPYAVGLVRIRRYRPNRRASEPPSR